VRRGRTQCTPDERAQAELARHRCFLPGLLRAAVPMAGHALARRLPGMSQWATRALVSRLQALLQRYGHAEFQTDAVHYQPATSRPGTPGH